MLAVTDFPSLAALPSLAAAGLFAAAAGWLYFAQDRVAGSTLRSAWAWSLFSCVCLACSELVLAASKPDAFWAAHLRYAAAATTCTPLMAVLGAKRPQHRGWQFVVATLLVVLWLPAAQAAVFWPQAPLALHPAMELFLALLVVLGALNYIATRNAVPVLLACAGQALLLHEHLPLVRSATESWLSASQGPLGAAGLFLLSLVAARWRAARWAGPPPGIDRAWLAFRDRFGTFWGLRVLGRFHAAAVICRWPVTLGWHGLVPLSSAPDAPAPSAQQQQSMVEQMATLLRRFESPLWLQTHLPIPLAAQPCDAGQRSG